MSITLLSGCDFTSNIHILRDSVSDIPKSETLTFIPFSDWDSDEDFIDFKNTFRRLGFKKFIKYSLDIHSSFVLENAVLDTPFIFLGGGNTYYFLETMKKRNFLKKLKNYHNIGGKLGGMSAGAIILSPNISTASYPAFDCDENVNNLRNYQSIGLYDYEFFPHFKNSKRYIEELSIQSKRTPNEIYAARDSSGIIETSNETSVYGDIWVFQKGELSKI